MAARVTSVNLESTLPMRASMRGSINEGRRSAIGLLQAGEVSGASAGTRRSAGLHDTSDLLGGPLDVVVDHDVVERLVADPLFVVGPGEAPLDGRGIVGAAGFQAAPLLGPAGCPHEDQ